MGIVPLLGLVLHVGGGNRDAALTLFRSVVDLIEGLHVSTELGGQHPGQGGRQGGFAMVDVTNGANVHMRLTALEFLFRHFLISSTVRG